MTENIPSERTAARLIHRNATTEAGWKSLRSVAIAVAALAFWIWLGGASVRSMLFLFVGLTALGACSSTYTWYRMRRFDPESVPAGEREARARDARLEAQKLRATLAARPARITYALLACIVVPSMLEVGSHGRWVEIAGLVKEQVRSGAWWRLLTATYLHAGFLHLWFNGTALFALGRLTEAYVPRIRLPLVYLLSGLGGGLSSAILMPHTPSVGASGAIMGIVGYLFVLGRRRRAEVPPGLAQSMLGAFVTTAYIGLVGFAFIDNACHLGGALTGALVGHLTIPRVAAAEPSTEFIRQVDQAGWFAMIVLVGGALATSVLLLQTR